MTVPFRNIPATLRTPLFYAEVDGSRLNTAQAGQRVLILAPKTDGDAPADVAALSLGVADAKARLGLGSIAALMVEWYRKRDTYGELWVAPLADAGGGVAATGTIAFTGPATAAGVLSLYVAGTLLAVPVTSGMTATQLGAAVAAAVTAATDLPVTAANVTGTVTFTAKNKGEPGNAIDLRLNYRGLPEGEKTPAGIAAVVTAMSGGATNPTLTAALANLGDKVFDVIVSPFTDATSLDALKAFLDDVSGRWSWSSQQYGHAFTAHPATYANLVTKGAGRNDPHNSIAGVYDSPTPAWLWAANLAGAAAVSLRADPNLPLQTLALDVLAPPQASRFTLAQQNVLLQNGISTFTVDEDGTVRIQRVITTYRVNAFGQADDSFLPVERMFGIAWILRDLQQLATTTMARKKLGNDGVKYAPGANVVTPDGVKGQIISRYKQREEEGYVQNAAAFAANIIVERNRSNSGRLDMLWPGSIIDGLVTFATLAQLRPAV